MNLRAYLFLAGSVLLFVPSQAHANGIWGSPLMLAHRFQLFIGNALIGVLEAYVISRLFGVGILRALVAMVPANYFSTWCVAILFLFGRIGMRGDIFGLTPYGHPWILAGVTYIMFLLASLVLEWPFVMWVRFSDQAEGDLGASRGACRSKPRGMSEQGEGRLGPSRGVPFRPEDLTG